MEEQLLEQGHCGILTSVGSLELATLAPYTAHRFLLPFPLIVS
jgi:hypothetical protein